MEEILGFLRRLHDHNDREWFDAHRDEWTRAKRRFAAFTERLIAGSEYAELLKLKSFGIEKPIPGEVLPDTDALLEYAVGEFRRTQPFVAQLNRAVAYAYEEMR